MRRFFTRWSSGDSRTACAVRFLSAVLFLAAAFLLSACGSAEKKKESTAVRIGVGLYRSDDTFINNLRKELEQAAREYEQESGRKIILDIQAANGSQSTQNRQAERFLSLNCDVLCINPVDRMAVSPVIDRAMAAGVPVVFFNRQPSGEDMNRWDRLCYVGVDARETAVLQGQIVADCWKKEPILLDRNGDGVVTYVLLEGETSHQDSLIRTEWSVKTILEAGVPIERLTGGIANWERSQASALMEQWLRQYPGQIELVLSNNDDMALGALDALERMEVSNIQVVGIDATEPGTEAVESGRMMGTVSANKAEYARAVFRQAIAFADGEALKEEEKYYWCRQEVMVP